MMRIVTRLAGCVLVAGAVLSPHATAETPSDFGATMALTTQGGEALHRVELPVAVYAGVQHADLRDVRVFNAANELVPYALVNDVPRPPAPGALFSPAVFPVWAVPGKRTDQLDVEIEQRADGSVVSIRTKGAPAKPESSRHAINYIVDASQIELPVITMRPQWSAVPDNYIGSARVEASDNLKDWRPVVGGASLVYLAQGATRLQQDLITFAPMKAKFYRISFGAQAPLLSGLQTQAPALRPDAKRQSVRVAGHPGVKPGEIEFDVGVHAPVDRLRVVVNQTNALAPIRIDSRADARAEWRPVVSTIAYRIVRDGKEVASTEIPIAPNSSPAWRIVVDPASGGLGMPPPELEASWPARNLVFLARGAGPYTLAFGRKDATVAALPLTSLIPAYREDAEGGLPVAAIGEVRMAPPPSPPLLPSFLGELELQRVGLWAALLIGVLLLAAMAWRLSKQMQKGAAAAPESAAAAAEGSTARDDAAH